MPTMNSQTIKIWVGTVKKLRMIFALTGEKMTKILDRLVTDELDRIKKDENYKID